ncbi:MAG: hypothetical protein QM736_21710 [Vicinamibacterales bacterium]
MHVDVGGPCASLIWSRSRKRSPRSPGVSTEIGALADFIRGLEPADVPVAVAFLTGSLRQGRIGIGYAAIRQAADVAPATEPTLTLAGVDQVFATIAGVRGSGSAAARVGQLHALYASATSDEQDFLSRLLFGELRQGAVEGVLLDAVAKAAAVPADRLRRAAMLAGALEPVAVAALTEGERALTAMQMTLFAPVQPMLAASAEGVEEAFAETGPASVEYKNRWRPHTGPQVGRRCADLLAQPARCHRWHS